MVRRLACVIFLAISTVGVAQERFTLATPEVKTTPDYRVKNFDIAFDNPDTTPIDEGTLRIELVGPNDESLVCRYSASTSPTGTFLNNALQKANLSTAYAGNATTGSLKYRICHRLVVMGESTAVCGKTIAGSCTGPVP